MPDKRAHRGPHPEDERSFAPSQYPLLRRAVEDLSWLLTRGYTDRSSLKLIGDRYQLTQRQRMAVMRCACSDEARVRRRQHQVEPNDIAGRLLMLDGYNVLTTIEAALAGGFIVLGRDGCYRDMASMHGSFRKVAETVPAIELVGQQVDALQVTECLWYLDRPVSNSGRLKTAILAAADEHCRHWQVELVDNPDRVLSESEEIVVTADSVILDRCARWFNLARVTVDSMLPDSRIADLAGAAGLR